MSDTSTDQTTVPVAVPAVRTDRLTKVYGDTTAVDTLTIEVPPGEVFGLLGPNGAGKTTTILALLGLTEPTSGTAEVMGLDAARHPIQVKQHVGYLPDNVGFYDIMTGRQNLRYTAALNGWKGPRAERRVGELLARVGLTDAADRRVHGYSRGMRQRLGIADALVKDPQVVILDEPTMAIDPQGVEEILALITSLAHDRGAAVLLSSHMLHQVEQVCDRVAIFVAGRVIAQGSRAELATSYAGGRRQLRVALLHVVDVSTGSAALAAVPGVEEVRDVSAVDPLLEVTCVPEAVHALAPALVGAGVGLVGLTPLHTGLDEIYRRYFADPDPATDLATAREETQ